MPPRHGNKPHGAIRKNLPHKSGFHKPHWVERLEVSVSGRLQNYRTADCRLSQYSLRHHHTTACLSPVAYAEIETYLRRYLCFCFRSGEGRCEVAHRVKIFWVLARRFALDGACLEVSSSPAMTQSTHPETPRAAGSLNALVRRAASSCPFAEIVLCPSASDCTDTRISLIVCRWFSLSGMFQKFGRSFRMHAASAGKLRWLRKQVD